MAVVKAAVYLVMGLLLIYGGGVEFLAWVRARSRRRRVPGVIVGRTEVLGTGPGTHTRSARFQFTTEQGRVIDKESSFYSFPGPKVGKAVTVSYDPQNPRKSAEIAWVAWLKVIVSLPLMAGGIVFLIMAGMSI
jgi:Protein of unknown function (DUF3592)